MLEQLRLLASPHLADVGQPPTGPVRGGVNEGNHSLVRMSKHTNQWARAGTAPPAGPSQPCVSVTVWKQTSNLCSGWSGNTFTPLFDL